MSSLTIGGQISRVSEPVIWEQFLVLCCLAIGQLTLNGFDVLDSKDGFGNGLIRSG